MTEESSKETEVIEKESITKERKIRNSTLIFQL